MYLGFRYLTDFFLKDFLVLLNHFCRDTNNHTSLEKHPYCSIKQKAKAVHLWTFSPELTVLLNCLTLCPVSLNTTMMIEIEAECEVHALEARKSLRQEFLLFEVRVKPMLCIIHVSKLDFGDLGLYNGPQTP